MHKNIRLAGISFLSLILAGCWLDIAKEDIQVVKISGFMVNSSAISIGGSAMVQGKITANAALESVTFTIWNGNADVTDGHGFEISGNEPAAGTKSWDIQSQGQVIVSPLPGVASGTYTLKVAAQAGNGSQSATVSFIVLNGILITDLDIPQFYVSPSDSGAIEGLITTGEPLSSVVFSIWRNGAAVGSESGISVSATALAANKTSWNLKTDGKTTIVAGPTADPGDYRLKIEVKSGALIQEDSADFAIGLPGSVLAADTGRFEVGFAAAPYSSSDSLDLDKLRQDMNNRDGDPDSLEVTNLIVAFDGSQSFMAANAGTAYVLSVYFIDPATGSSRLLLQTNPTSPLVFNANDTLLALNHDLFGTTAVTSFRNALRDPDNETLPVSAIITLPNGGTVSGSLRMKFIAVVAD